MLCPTLSDMSPVDSRLAAGNACIRHRICLRISERFDESILCGVLSFPDTCCTFWMVVPQTMSSCLSSASYSVFLQEFE